MPQMRSMLNKETIEIQQLKTTITNKTKIANPWRTNTIRLTQSRTQKVNTINTWSNETKNKLASAQKGSYANTLSSLDTGTLNNLVSRGLMSEGEANGYLQTAANTFESYYDTNKITKFDPSGNPAYDPPAGGVSRI